MERILGLPVWDSTRQGNLHNNSLLPTLWQRLYSDYTQPELERVPTCTPRPLNTDTDRTARIKPTTMKRFGKDALNKLEEKSKDDQSEKKSKNIKTAGGAKRRLDQCQNLDQLLSSPSVVNSVAIGVEKSEDALKKIRREGSERAKLSKGVQIFESEDKNAYFQRIMKNSSAEDIYFEYENFLKKLPPLISSQRIKVVNEVRRELNIKDIESARGDTKQLSSSSPFPDTERGTPIIDALGIKLGKSFNFLVPPTTKCLHCYRELTFHNEPTQVPVFTLTGPMLFSKYIWRCRKCLHDNTDVMYYPDSYGNTREGVKFYPTKLQVKVTRASTEVYMTNMAVKGYLSELQHGWLSGTYISLCIIL